MPLEIRELHIKVEVNNPAGNAPQGAGPQMPPTIGQQGDEKDALLGLCVDEIMELINNKKER